MAGEQHLKKSVMLRGQGDYQGAIDEILNNRGSFDEYTLVPGLLQAFYAARQAGNDTLAKQLANELAKEEPELPSIQNYL